MRTGEIVGAAERLTPMAALRALTVGGAWVMGAEREQGTLAPGRRADLAVFDRNPLEMRLDELPSLECRLTLVGGRAVHGGL